MKLIKKKKQISRNKFIHMWMTYSKDCLKLTTNWEVTNSRSWPDPILSRNDHPTRYFYNGFVYERSLVQRITPTVCKECGQNSAEDTLEVTYTRYKVKQVERPIQFIEDIKE